MVEAEEEDEGEAMKIKYKKLIDIPTSKARVLRCVLIRLEARSVVSRRSFYGMGAKAFHRIFVQVEHFDTAQRSIEGCGEKK